MNLDGLAATFARDGVALCKGLFSAEELAPLEADFDRIVARLQASSEDINARWDAASAYEAAADTSVVHTHHVQNHAGSWLRALTHKPLLDAAEAIIGPDLVLHHSKLFQKPPGHGAPFPMHQDWRYFPTTQDTMIAAIIHVTAATVDMGCVRAFPGSHRIGRRPSTSGRMLWDDADEYRAFLDEYPLESAVTYEAEPGDVLFFSYFTVHGSGRNTSSLPRKTVLLQLFSGADQVDPSSEHSVSGLVLRGHNHHATRNSVVAGG